MFFRQRNTTVIHDTASISILSGMLFIAGRVLAPNDWWVSHLLYALAIGYVINAGRNFIRNEMSASEQADIEQGLPHHRPRLTMSGGLIAGTTA